MGTMKRTDFEIYQLIYRRNHQSDKSRDSDHVRLREHLKNDLGLEWVEINDLQYRTFGESQLFFRGYDPQEQIFILFDRQGKSVFQSENNIGEFTGTLVPITDFHNRDLTLFNLDTGSMEPSKIIIPNINGCFRLLPGSIVTNWFHGVEWGKGRVNKFIDYLVQPVWLQDQLLNRSSFLKFVKDEPWVKADGAQNRNPGRYPAASLSASHITQFAQSYQKKHGVRLRVPDPFEWELAARAGTYTFEASSIPSETHSKNQIPNRFPWINCIPSSALLFNPKLPELMDNGSFPNAWGFRSLFGVLSQICLGYEDVFARDIAYVVSEAQQMKDSFPLIDQPVTMNMYTDCRTYRGTSYMDSKEVNGAINLKRLERFNLDPSDKRSNFHNYGARLAIDYEEGKGLIKKGIAKLV